MDIVDSTLTFVTKYNGHRIDEDGQYGTQCWDLVARFAKEIIGCSPFPTVSGGAEGLYRLYGTSESYPIPNFFDRIANDGTNIPQAGDILVYNSAFSRPYGHTALVISADNKRIAVLEQDGSIDDGIKRDGNTIARAQDGIADGVAYQTVRGYINLYGWLRAKGAAIDMASTVGEVEFNDLYRAFFGPMERNPVTSDDRKRWIGAETNTVIREMEADARHMNYLRYILDIEKAIQSPHSQLSGLTSDQDMALSRIDRNVQDIKQIVSDPQVS